MTTEITKNIKKKNISMIFIIHQNILKTKIKNHFIQKIMLIVKNVIQTDIIIMNKIIFHILKKTIILTTKNQKLIKILKKMK